MNDIAKHYFESHVTIEPIFDIRLLEIETIAKKYGFKVAKLLMQKRADDSPERSRYDTFMTAHGKELEAMKRNICNLIGDLKENEFKVWRYKIEDTVLDSRISDELNLL